MINFPQILSQSYSVISPIMKKKLLCFSWWKKIVIILFPILFSCLLLVLTFHTILSYPANKSNHSQIISPDLHSPLIKQTHPRSKYNKIKWFSVAPWVVGRTILLCQKLSFVLLLIHHFLFKMYITWFKEC